MTKRIEAIFTSDTEVEEIADGLCRCSLPRDRWTHAAHFAAAVWLLRDEHKFDWRRQMPTIIRAYNESVGKQNTDQSGYHETITFASMRMTELFLTDLPNGVPTFAVVNQLLGTSLGRKDWVLSYWTSDLLFDVAARRNWVEPNLAPLPSSRDDL